MQKLLGSMLLGAVYYATTRMKAAGQYFPVKLVKVVITLASVNEVLNEIYEVTVLFLNEIYEGTVLFDTECQMKFGNIKFKLSS